jgi:RNA polymerase sigma-70 factor (ECF subfamily)
MGGPLADLKTLLQAQSRNPGAREKCFDRVWREYYPKLMVFVRGYGAGGQGDAEDLVQEIMEKVFRGLGSYDSRYGISTWIYAVARNHCLDRLRKRGRAPDPVSVEELPASTQPADHATPERRFLAEEDGSRLRDFLDAADTETRQLAFLRFYQGMSCGGIAEIMGIPLGTVKFRLHRLRANVRAHMEADL